ncbi:MAG: FIVAR domain-containing protein [Clostridia bacterium]|nr:FIVAR domain-containing protein [Clostridia bacterium]
MNKTMKQFFKKLFAIVLVLTLVFCINLPASAAVSPTKKSVNPGDVVTLKYTYKGIAGINGEFIYSNPALFSNVKFNISGLSMGKYNDKTKQIAFFGTEPVNCTITLTLTVAKNAKIGDKCDITLKYETTADGDMPAVPDYKYDKSTVSVVEKLDFSDLKALVNKADGLKKSLYTPETWAPFDTALKAAKNALNKATTQKEIDSAESDLKAAMNALEKLPDYAELNKQIKLAEALNKADYTSKTWDALAKALSEAKKALASESQTEIDAATRKLKNAINGLVSIYEGKLNFTELDKQIAIADGLKAKDYAAKGWNEFEKALQNARKAKSSKLQGEIDLAAAELKNAIAALTKMDYKKLLDAINAIDEYISGNEFLNLWEDSQGLLKDANNALTSRDQVTVDTYAQKLVELLAKLKQAVDGAAGNETVAPPEPVPVEPENYCNVKSHPVWIILFWVSFAVNIALGALILMYCYAKRKKTTDDTPLVDYDITDDME